MRFAHFSFKTKNQFVCSILQMFLSLQLAQTNDQQTANISETNHLSLSLCGTLSSFAHTLVGSLFTKLYLFYNIFQHLKPTRKEKQTNCSNANDASHTKKKDNKAKEKKNQMHKSSFQILLLCRSYPVLKSKTTSHLLSLFVCVRRL